MPARPTAARFARFGIFEADLQERMLHRNGLKVKLQNQPFEVLVALLERPGETVTSEELFRRVWPDGTYVEFEHSLSTAVLKIRRALQDSAASPRFVETIPRHGYRFIAPVQLAGESRFAPGDGPRARRMLHWAVPLVAVAALVVAVMAYLAPRRTGRAEFPTPMPLTTMPGWEHSPSFSPDGDQVAYSWCEEGAWQLKGNCDIFVRSVGSESSLRLTDHPWVDGWPAWSPDGSLIAFLRLPLEGMASYLLIPAASGRERELTETLPPVPSTLFGAAISWFPDGKHLAVVVRDATTGPHSVALLTVETGARRALTDAAPSGIGDTAVAVSPDGRRIAFARTGLARTPFSDIYIADLSDDLTLAGTPRRLVADQPAPVSLAWMPGGDAITFSSGGSLWRMSVDGSARTLERLSFAGVGAADPALSRDGRRLAYSQRHVSENIWHLELTGGGEAAGAASELISSTREDAWPQYSADGRRIAFLSDRSGARQVYVCDAGGSDLRRLTSLAGGIERPYPGWSPDGRQVVFSARVEGNTDVFVVDVQGGPPRRLTFEPSTEFHPQWSRDGKWIYFASDRTRELQVWKMPLGGQAVQVTQKGGEGPFESPDGRHLYYFKAGTAGAEQLWRRRLPDGEEQQVLQEVFRGNFAMARARIYFIPQRDVGCDCYHLQRLDLATGKTHTLIDIGDVGGGLTVSSDGRSLLYTTVVRTSADLLLVEGFR